MISCFVRNALCYFLLLWGAACSGIDPGHPNIVLILSDDHGYSDFGFMGSPHVETPHLDRLAREGTVFPTTYVTASVCRPSLRTLLTGLYPYQWELEAKRHQNDARSDASQPLVAKIPTLPRRLAERGYRSFQAGKFWEGNFAQAGFTHGNQRDQTNLQHGGSDLKLGRPSIDSVLAFIDQNRNEPFFLWFAPQLPHVPFDAPRESVEHYRDKGLSRAAAHYYANITRFDSVVGALLAHLDRRGLRENTIVVFLADNGWDMGPQHREFLSDMEQGKGAITEVSLRTPLILRWPSRIPAGQVHAALISSVDIVPTLLDWTGAPITPELLGQSLRPLIEDGRAGTRTAIVGRMRSIRNGGFYTRDDKAENGPAYFVRTRDWHYAWNQARMEHQLYDVRLERSRRHNVVEQHPNRALEFQHEVSRWTQQVRAPAGFSLRKSLHDNGFSAN